MIACERYVPEDGKFCNEYVMWKIFKYYIAVYSLFMVFPIITDEAVETNWGQCNHGEQLQCVG
jgi:hypothetical protein